MKGRPKAQRRSTTRTTAPTTPVQRRRHSDMVQRLQRTMGNRAAQHVLQAMARRPGEPQRHDMDGDDSLQMMSASPAPPAHTARAGGAGRSGGLPDGLRAGLETLSGTDLSDVRVHTNSSKPAGLDALAYTQGRDIHVAPGEERHLAHEGWHAVQQKQGRVRPTVQAKGIPVNDDTGLEREADVMGAKAMQMSSAHPDRSHQSTVTPSTTVTQTVSTARQPVQRAMKFEYQTRKNRLFRDDGTRVLPLPRKFGPQDYLVKGSSGVRLESEERGRPSSRPDGRASGSSCTRRSTKPRRMTDQMNAAPRSPAATARSIQRFLSMKHKSGICAPDRASGQRRAAVSGQSGKKLARPGSAPDT